MQRIPTEYELPAWEEKYKKVRQRGHYWCVAAGIEILLKYYDNIPNTTQEELVLSYCKIHGNEALRISVTGKLVQIEGLSDNEIIHQAQYCQLDKASFWTISNAAKKLIDLKSLGYEFIPAQGTQFCIFKEEIVNHHPFIMGIQPPGKNVHVLAVYGYKDYDHPTDHSNDLIYIYDPATGHSDKKTATQLNINLDGFFLKPIKKINGSAKYFSNSFSIT